MIAKRFVGVGWWVGCIWLLLAAELPAQTLLDQLERRLSEAERADAGSSPNANPNARPTLGISVAAVTESAVAKYGLAVRQGALVAHVEPAGLAAQQGIREGDVVVAFNGRRVDAPQELVAAMTQARVGETVELTWYSGRRLARKTISLPGEVDPFAIVRPPTTAATNGVPGERNSGSGSSGAGNSSITYSGGSASRNRPAGKNNVTHGDREGSGSTDPFGPRARVPQGGRQPLPLDPGPLGDQAAPGLLGGSQLAEPAGRLADRLEASGRPLLGRLGQLIDRVAAEAQVNETTDPAVARALRTAPLASAAVGPPATAPPGAPQRPAAATSAGTPPVNPPATSPLATPASPALASPAPGVSPMAAENAALIAELIRVNQLVIRLQQQIEQLEQRLQTLENAPASRQ